MKKVVNYFLYAIFLSVLLYCAVGYKSEISGGVTFAIDYCLNNLIPSLFPMIFLACMISASPVNDIICYCFSFFTRRVLKVPNCLASVVVFGLCCGYPVGAKLCSNLLKEKKITKETAENALMYLVNPGVPFAVLFVGGGVFASFKLGFYMFFSTALASLLISFLMGINKKTPTKESYKQTKTSFLQCFDISAKSALSATVNMCLYIVIFSAFIPLLYSLKIMDILIFLTEKITFLSENEINSLFSFFTEVVHGVTVASQTNVSAFIYLIGLAFGGICIHFQILSMFENDKKLVIKFFTGRVLHVVFSYGIFKSLLYFFPIAVSTFNSFENLTVETTKANATGSICLVVLSLTFIYCNILVEKPKHL
ncbi:MAG: hypothetical protein R3Y35_04790 [Clostridia bacterium]